MSLILFPTATFDTFNYLQTRLLNRGRANILDYIFVPNFMEIAPRGDHNLISNQTF
jgi:hypothetical protein